MLAPATYAGTMTLRRVNLVVGAALVVQAAVVTVFLVGVAPVLLPVTADFGGGIPVASVNIGAATVVLLVFAALGRLVKPSPLARWIEWSQVAGVTVFLAQLKRCDGCRGPRRPLRAHSGREPVPGAA